MAIHSSRFYKSGLNVGFICLTLILMLAGVTAVPRSAFAASVTVTTTTDTLDASAGNCANITLASLPGPDGVTSLREAICAANNTAGDDTITFSTNGTFTLTRTGVDDGNQNGDLDLLSNITITGNGAANTILNGNNTDRIFDIDPLQSSNAVVSISGVTITNGHADPATFNLGAGVATGASSIVTISNSTITSNNSVNGSGGGIESFGQLTLTNVTVSNNIADGQGGGIRAIRPLTINGSSITGNSAELGAGLWLGSSTGRDMSITDSTISGNHAVDRPGGLGSGSQDGGGLYIDMDSIVSISRSTISGNDASRNGGGIYFRDQPGTTVGVVNLTNSTVSGNRANGDGGGLYVESGTLNVNYSTLPLNRADDDNNASGTGGGAFRLAGTATFQNSILAGNVLGSGAQNNCSAGLTSGGYNLFGDNTVCPQTTGDANLVVLGLGITAVINTTLANNGGPTATHALVLSAGNPAIDTANPSGCLATDQRGTARPIGPLCDKGSFESATPPPPTNTPTDTPTNTPAPPTNTPTDTPTNTPVPPTNTPTDTPTNTPVPPTNTPTDTPTNTPVPPTNTPTDTPTDTPVPPTNTPTSTPTNTPTNTPIPNRPPVANSDSYSVSEDTTLNVAAPGVLGNDNDPDVGDTLTAVLVSGPSHGSLTLNANGSFSYTPAANYNGTDSFSYKARDAGGLESAPATVSINVNAVNDPPTITVAAGAQCSASGVGGTMNLTVVDIDSPVNGVSLSGSSSNTGLVPNANIVFGGSGPDRTVSVTVAPKKSGTATVTITANDGNGGTSTTTITVIVGTDKKETINGTAGADMIFGLNGDDTINAGGGNDLVCGGNGNGVMSGGDGDDTLDGGNGNDTIRGDNGNDTLIGGLGNDTLTGGAGADFFSGGPGNDTATDITPSQGDTQDGTIP